jgi:hypothetical protein
MQTNDAPMQTNDAISHTTTSTSVSHTTTTTTTTKQTNTLEYDFENDDDAFYDFIDFGIASNGGRLSI